MGDRDLPSDSDSSDEDFRPEGEDVESVSENESSHDSVEHEANEEDVGENKKRKKSTRKRIRKKLKTKVVEEANNVEKKETEMSAEDKKQRADALWADFLKDSDPIVKKKTPIPSLSLEPETKEKKPKEKVVEEYQFAGEKVLVEKEVASPSNGTGKLSAQSSISPCVRGRGGGRGGIASILSQIGKKNKLSTLEKSKLDWDTFKKDEGIKEDVERYNKGKNGYLERQDFLERADLRQFEIEKNLRAAKRSSLR